MFRKSILKIIGKGFGRKYSAEPFLQGQSATYIEEMYNAWMKDPKTVHASWDAFFRSVSSGAAPGKAYQAPPNLAPEGRHEVSVQNFAPSSSKSHAELGEVGDADKHYILQLIVRAYQMRGHLVSDLDPLKIRFGNLQKFENRSGGLDPEILDKLTQHILSETDIDKKFKVPLKTFIGGKDKYLTLKEIIERLEKVYCRTVGAEYTYITDEEECDWMRAQLEVPGCRVAEPHVRVRTLHRLIRATKFEEFLSKKWPSDKRFGLEGCESAVLAMKQIIDKSSENGVDTVIMGLAHRGRLNFLTNVCRKPLEEMFTQFAGLEAEDEGSGDVKYHLGTYIQRTNRATGKLVKLSILANPSHLEAVDPLVQGRTRAEQFYRGDEEGKHVMSILVHGDAAFCGQGIVYETFTLSDLPRYETHGTIHIAINNQIGFTTDPRFSRSSPYCSDVGRVVNAPILHVNADDPDAVIHVSNIAAEYRATFHKDIVIDVVGYRRNGHNEIDEPMFTQPLMYKIIKQTPNVAKKYADLLIKEGVITEEDIKRKEKTYEAICEEGYEKAKEYTTIRLADWIDSPWSSFFEGKDPIKTEPTGVSETVLLHIGEAFSTPPPENLDFVLHKGIERILKGRKDMLEKQTVDWAIAEAMAFGSLLKEGIHVRLSGQDVERGTFSHRHHVYYHQNKDKVMYCPLDHIYPDQAHYSLCNSSLSEYGVLGFEVGYSMTNPHSLVLWEAQFGDFNNTAQPIIDQFICSGQSKWIRQCGIVLLQPHGLEGMGPEHSSARLERFLQLSHDDDDVMPEEGENYEVRHLKEINWIIANPTTPANYFHLLRRQVKLPFRKPLIIMTPKSLLRHPEARSQIEDMTENSSFQRIISDDGPASQNPGDVKKLIFCSGKVFHDIQNALKANNLENIVAVTRIEQICPFPYDLLRLELEKYPNARVEWTQEEHKNMGAWTYVKPRFATLTQHSRKIDYNGRPSASSPATGSKFLYQKELNQLISNIITP